MNNLILASGSPRRKQLLSTLGIPFDVKPSDADETLPENMEISKSVEAVALRKAQHVAGQYAADALVLGADTVVVLDGCVLCKPADRDDAIRMLKMLSGRTHRVITGVAFAGSSFERVFSVLTEVRFRELSNEQISWYTSLDEPYDKAGAYAIQEKGAFMTAAITGSFTNVIGLPMAETAAVLDEAGLTPWTVSKIESQHG